MIDTKELIRVLGFIQEYFDNHTDEQEPDARKELFMDWSKVVLETIDILKAQEPIKPQARFNPAGQPMWCCGNCGTTLFFRFPRQTDDEDEKSIYGFCNYCGRAVKWG